MSQDRTHVIMNSIHPAREDELVARMRPDGWTLAPPWPGEEGVARFVRPHRPGWRPAPIAPPRPPLVTRQSGPWPPCIIVAGTALAAAVLGVLARG